MKLVEKICFPTDLGKSSEAALESVMTIAKKFGSEVFLVHVLPDPKFRDRVQSIVEKEMARYIGLLEEQGIECTSDILLGDHMDELVPFAQRKRADLIVLGAGHTGKKKYKLGSNSEKIIRSSPIPVWVIEEGSGANIERALCPIDFSEDSLLALENAIHLCRRFGSELHILHVIKGIDPEYTELGADTHVEQAEKVKAAELEFEELVQGLDLSGIAWAKEVRLGSPAAVILDVIKEKNIDLVMMAPTGKGAFKRLLLGSVAEKVSREVPCSFIMNRSAGMIHLKLDQEIKDIEAIYAQGAELEKQGFVQEAIVEWKRCIMMNEFYLKAWSAIANAYERLGDPESAAKFNASRERVQRMIWDQQVEADLKGKHFLYK